MRLARAVQQQHTAIFEEIRRASSRAVIILHHLSMRRACCAALYLAFVASFSAALRMKPASPFHLQLPRPWMLSGQAGSWRARATASLVSFSAAQKPLAIGTGDGLGDGGGLGITGVAWVDVLYVFFFLGICGLVYTTTIDDFGEADNPTFNTAEAEWSKRREAPPVDDKPEASSPDDDPPFL